MGLALAKDNAVRSKKLTNAARGTSCIQCGSDIEGTVVLCHYQGIGSLRLGKGRGIKPDDFCGADLCQKCHAAFDGYERDNDYERAFEFMVLVLLTIRRRFEQGVIRIA